MKERVNESYFGKYRGIIFAVGLFFVLDLSILALNFYTSFQIDQDAIAINLAGRQRYMSQRIARTLLELDADRAAGRPYNEATLNELRTGADIFQRSLVAFRVGGVVPGGDGKPVQLQAVTTERGRALLADVESLWNPYDMLLQPIVGKPEFLPGELAMALAYSQTNNLALLSKANDFVTETQAIGASRASRLRLIQTAGILLSLLNFAYAIFASLQQLLRNDRQVAAAQKETAEILDTVKEGLFLVDPSFRVGSQRSASLPRVLGRPIEPGEDFREILKQMVAPSLWSAACDYIGLLFGDRVKESLVTQLNPLTEVEVMVTQPDGSKGRRFLTLQFNRAMQEGKISHLLVTVFDVTTQVELARALDEARQKSRSEFEVLVQILKVNPAALERFLVNTEGALLEVNDHLRSAGGNGDYRRTVNAIFRRIHAVKGEAAELGLEMFEDLAQQFESLLVGLRDKGAVSGDDLLALPLPLDEFLQRIGTVRELFKRLAAYHDAFASTGDDVELAENLDRLAQRIARDQGKEVQLLADVKLIRSLPENLRRSLGDLAVQLLRNAVAHGIEPTAERTQLSKPPQGRISVMLRAVGDGEYEFVLRDDGRGISPARIRAALLRTGRYSEAQLNELDDKAVVMKIFEPGVSTAATVTRDAGHGVGMDVVKQKIQQLGAKLRIASQENSYTQFSIRFAA